MSLIPLYDGQIPHFHDANGKLANGFRLYFFLHNTSTPVTVYKDSEGRVPYTNPIVLDARGESETPIYVDSTKVYKIILKDKKNAVVWEENEVSASAHVPATIPFAVDEDHFKVTMLGNTAVLSLADSFIEKLRAVTNTRKVENFMREVEGFITWNYSSCFINEALGLCVLNIACFAKVDTSSNLQEMFNNLAYKPMTRMYHRIGGSSELEITTDGKISGFNLNASADGSFFYVNVVYPYAR